MALVLKDRVRETSTTTGTGTFTLAGAVAGFQSFSAIGTGNSTYYTIVSTSDWEVGIGTWTSPNQLSRDTVLASTNAGALVTFGSGTKDVFVTLPSERATYLQNLGNRIVITNPVVPSNEGSGIIECVDDGIGDNYNDLRIYAEDQYGAKYAPFFSAGVSSANFVIRSQDWTTNYQYVILQVPSGMSTFYTLTLPTTAGSNNQVLKTDGSGNLSWTDKFVLGAGTATAGTAPLKFTSGTNLTTAEAGAMEYNGTSVFITGTTASGRGINFAPQMVRVNTDRAKTTNNTTLEAVFDAANDTLALAANTLYYFRGVYVITKSATATAGAVTIGFAFSNAQQDILYKSLGYPASSSTAQTSNATNLVTALTATATNTAAADYIVEFEGWFKSNATTGGTLIPQFAQTVVGTTVAPTAKANTWFMIQPMSSTPTATLIAGNWS